MTLESTGNSRIRLQFIDEIPRENRYCVCDIIIANHSIAVTFDIASP